MDWLALFFARIPFKPYLPLDSAPPLQAFHKNSHYPARSQPVHGLKELIAKIKYQSLIISSSKIQGMKNVEKTFYSIFPSFLKSDNFLHTALKAFLNKEIIVSSPSNYRLCFDRIEINKIIAQGIWQEELQDCDSDFIPYFINAIMELNVQDNEDDLLHLPSILRDITKTQQNLTKTTAFFESLEQQQEINCIVHKKLYYKTLEVGDSSSVCTSPKERLNFAFFDPLGRPLKCQSDACVNLDSTISGFAYAVKGMRKGETREIYVHPSLAYGIHTPYEKGIYLRAVVTLLDVEKTDEPFAELANMDVSFLENQDFLNSVKVSSLSHLRSSWKRWKLY